MGVSDDQLAILAVTLGCGLLLQILGCVIYANWWPFLVMVVNVIAPLPNFLFFGGQSHSEGEMFLAGNSRGFLGFGKFLLGGCLTSYVGLPAILAHAGVITPEALAFELAGAAFIFASGALYVKFISDSRSGGSAGTSGSAGLYT